jgi:hypothetical protein
MEMGLEMRVEMELMRERKESGGGLRLYTLRPLAHTLSLRRHGIPYTELSSPA